MQAYINFFLGNVIKCESIEELRQNRIGITADCVLYHSFRLQHINPENYTRRAYIGETSMRQRIRRLEKNVRVFRRNGFHYRKCWKKSAGSLSWKD